LSADLLVVRGRLWSGRTLEADALLVRDERIVALGSTAELRAASPSARIVDAGGATVSPGLVDAHLHLVPWARARKQLELAGCTSREEALERLRAALGSLPDDDSPLVGRGWDEGGWEAPPDARALDALAPRRPVLLHRHDFHALWVNGAALVAAGVSKRTTDPEGGRLERGPGGELTGLVREHAVALFHALEQRAAPAVNDALLDEAASALHAEGVTGVHDFQRNHDDWLRMRALAGRRRLRVLQHVGPEQVEAARSLGLRAGEGDAWFRTGSLKLFADGTLGSRTAALIEPYDDAPGRGMALLEPAAMASAVASAAAAGFSVAVHAIGDAAVRVALDAVERNHAALARVPLPARIEHAQLVDAADLPRFGALGVAASMQPQHAATDAPVARRAWGARCRRAYPWRALLESGATLAFGSDAPVEPPAARLGLAAAVHRLGADGAPFEPAQAVSLDVALRAYTESAAALAAGRLGCGRLEPGAPADLVVWDRDLHAAGAAELAQARPRFTALAGQIVYDSRSGAGAGGNTRVPARA